MLNKYQGFDYRVIQTVEKLMDLHKYISEHHELFDDTEDGVKYAIDVTYYIEVLVKKLQSI